MARRRKSAKRTRPTPKGRAMARGRRTRPAPARKMRNGGNSRLGRVNPKQPGITAWDGIGEDLEIMDMMHTYEISQSPGIGCTQSNMNAPNCGICCKSDPCLATAMRNTTCAQQGGTWTFAQSWPGGTCEGICGEDLSLDTCVDYGCGCEGSCSGVQPTTSYHCNCHSGTNYTYTCNNNTACCNYLGQSDGHAICIDDVCNCRAGGKINKGNGRNKMRRGGRTRPQPKRMARGGRVIQRRGRRR